MKRLRIVLAVATAVATLLGSRAPASAQAPAALRVTVADPSGAVIPGATVAVAGAEDATRSVKRTGTTGADGIATIAGLAPGRYLIEAAFPGFETQQLKDV